MHCLFADIDFHSLVCLRAKAWNDSKSTGSIEK